MESPPSSPQLRKEILESNVADEYLNFLATLQTGEISIEDDNDIDYNYWDDIIRNNPEFMDTEEYRNDKAVSIPKQEIEELLEDAQQVDNNTVVIPKPQKIPKKQLYKQVRKLGAASVDKLKPLRPFVDFSVNYLFTPFQLEMLTSQLRDHFQLLVHVFLLSRVQSFQKGQKECSSQVGCWDLLRDLYQKTSDSAAKYQASLIPSNNSLNIVNSKPMRKPVYDIPGIDMLPNLYNFALIDQQPTLGSANAMLALFKPFFNTRYTINIHSFTSNNDDISKSKIGGSIVTPNRLKFTPAEDSLLAIGLEKFGSSKWNLIKQYLLPTKTESQIMNRYKNRSSRSAEENPIKAYKISKNTPLSNEEIQLLYEGIRYYGYQWDLISSKLLPHRQSSVLAKAYKRLQKENNNTSDNNNNDPKAKRLKTSSSPNNTTIDAPLINQNFLRDSNVNSKSNISPISNTIALSKEEIISPAKLDTDNSNSIFYTSEGIPFTLADLQFNEEDSNNTNNSNNIIIREDTILAPSNISDDSSDEDFEHVELNDSLEQSLQCQEKWSEIEVTPPPPLVTTNKADNKLVVDGVDVVFQKSEDAAILNAVKSYGASSDTWQSLMLSGMNKTENQIAERYQQLLLLMKQRSVNKC